jgi:hypothetical protein
MLNFDINIYEWFQIILNMYHMYICNKIYIPPWINGKSIAHTVTKYLTYSQYRDNNPLLQKISK